MKHLKTFEQHHANDLNESLWGDAKKFVTGHENSEDRDDKKTEFLNQLDEIEVMVNKDPESWQFNREHLMKAAESNNYRGALRTQKGGRNTSINYVIWNNKATGLQDIAGSAGGSTQKH